MKAEVGQALDRVDGRAKVTGATRFAADFRAERMAHAVLVTSAVARGTVEPVRTQAASATPGVILVLTRENMPSLRLPKSADERPYGEALTTLYDGKIQFAGQVVALVVAETLQQAQEGAAALKVHYREELPVMETSENEAAAIIPKESHGEKAQDARGKLEEALETPGLIKTEADYRNPVETHNPMESAAVMAQWDGDHLTVHESTRWLMGSQATLAQAFGLSKQNVHVICPAVGGAFGCKAFRWSHTILTAAAARMARRPVRLVLTRAQMFGVMGHRPRSNQRILLAAGPDGRLAGIRHETTAATSPVTPFLVASGVVSKMVYACPNVTVTHKLVPTNMATPTYMRAPAECPGMFALECAMDELAEAVKLDPLEIRIRNHADIDPATGRLWSSKNLMECYELGAQKFGWKQRPPRARELRDGPWLIGWGMATATYPGHRRTCSARARILADGTAVVQCAAHEIGNGAATVLAQASADAIGWPLERVTFQLGDTAYPDGPPAGGSVTTASVSDAIEKAARAAQAKLAQLAVEISNSPFAALSPEKLSAGDGRIFAGSNASSGMKFEEILRAAGKDFVEAEATSEQEALKTKGFTIQSFGVHFCEVRVDGSLGQARVTRWVSVLDVGRVMNPKTARSQALGGIVMGIGMALHEATIYDSRSGRPVNDNFADYLIPVNADIGAMDIHFLDKPDPCINSLGCRGAGELPITGATAAVANAIWHATGKRIRDLPITPDKLI